MSEDKFETPKGSFSREDLHKRVRQIEPGVFELLELPKGSPATLRVLGDHALEMGRATGKPFTIVVNLQEATGAPGSEYRKFIPSFLTGHMLKSASYVAIAWHGNPMARMAAKFLVSKVGSLSIHNDVQEAVAMAREALSK